MKAHELLADKSKWSKDITAVDSYGYAIPFDDELAVAWSASGAIMKCYKDDKRIRNINIKKFEMECFKRYGMSAYGVQIDEGYEAILAMLKDLDI